MQDRLPGCELSAPRVGGSIFVGIFKPTSRKLTEQDGETEVCHQTDMKRSHSQPSGCEKRKKEVYFAILTYIVFGV